MSDITFKITEPGTYQLVFVQSTETLGVPFDGIDTYASTQARLRQYGRGPAVSGAIQSLADARVLFDGASMVDEEEALLDHNRTLIANSPPGFPANVRDFVIAPCVGYDDVVIPGLFVRPSFNPRAPQTFTAVEIRGALQSYARRILQNAYYEDRGRGANVGQG